LTVCLTPHPSAYPASTLSSVDLPTIRVGLTGATCIRIFSRGHRKWRLTAQLRLHIVDVGQPNLERDAARQHGAMENSLSAHVRDHRLDTTFLEEGIVEHSYDDPDVAPLSPLRIVERWESKKLLGSGGQGHVYLQRCITEDRLSACRAVKKIVLHEDDRRRRYIRELETIIRFSHIKVRNGNHLLGALLDPDQTAELTRL